MDSAPPRSAPRLRPNAVYTLQDLCSLLGLSRRAVRVYLYHGLLPCRRAGHGYRFLGRDILALIAHPHLYGYALPDELPTLLRSLSQLDA